MNSSNIYRFKRNSEKLAAYDTLPGAALRFIDTAQRRCARDSGTYLFHPDLIVSAISGEQDESDQIANQSRDSRSFMHFSERASSSRADRHARSFEHAVHLGSHVVYQRGSGGSSALCESGVLQIRALHSPCQWMGLETTGGPSFLQSRCARRQGSLRRGWAQSTFYEHQREKVGVTRSQESTGTFREAKRSGGLSVGFQHRQCLGVGSKNRKRRDLDIVLLHAEGTFLSYRVRQQWKNSLGIRGHLRNGQRSEAATLRPSAKEVNTLTTLKTSRRGD